MGGILDMGKIEMTDEYVRVGTTLYKIVFQPLINGTFAKRRVPWSMGTLRYDHGKDFIASVPKYDGFCTVPSHVDYKRNIGSFLNLYEMHDLPKEHYPDFPAALSKIVYNYVMKIRKPAVSVSEQQYSCILDTVPSRYT